MSKPGIFIPDELLDGASPGQKEKYRQLLAAKRARRSPLDYMLYDSKKNKEYRHTVLLNEVVMALVEKRLYKSGPGPESIVVDVTEEEPLGRRVHPETGEPVLYKLMTSMPPRIGKSFFFGKYFPAWFLTNNPDETIMYMSYAASLAENFSKRSRDTINDHPELGIHLDPENQSIKEWGLAEGEGGFIARGFGGIPTGRGGNLLIDDPFQSGDEAMSENRREFVWEQYVSSLITRVESECWTIVNGTRWHEDDLHGRLLEHEPDEWYVINLPAIAFDTVNEDGVSIDITEDAQGNELIIVDPLGRKPGEAICPQLYSRRFYEKRQKEDPFWYEAEYLGKPAGVSGNMFKAEHFKHFKQHTTKNESGVEVVYELFTGGDASDFVTEKDCVRFGTIDLAASDKQSADYTVMAIWELDPWNRLILREIIRERVTGDNHEDWIKENYVKWGLRVLGIEEASFGYTLIQNLISDADSPLVIWPLAADKNKKVRAIPVATLFKKGKVFVDRDADWRKKYESELKKFDRDAHDDQVDVTSYAAVMRRLIAAQPLPPPKSHRNSGFEGRMSRLADSEPAREPNVRMVISGA